MELKDKVAIVTGSGRGIGEGIALVLAREGARVVVNDMNLENANSVVRKIEALGSKAIAVKADITKKAEVDAMVAQTVKQFGTVDILVNNAGYGHHRRFLEWDLDDMERMLRVNFLGTLYWTKALLPQMVERRSGWIVFLASVAGKLGVPEESAYAASKFAMVGLAEALSIEVEDAGVHVLTVCPGAINTPFFDAEALQRMPAVSRRMMIEPERVIDAIIAALARGKHEITVPRFIATGYIVRALAPEFMRRNTKRTTIGAGGARR